MNKWKNWKWFKGINNFNFFDLLEVENKYSDFGREEMMEIIIGSIEGIDVSVYAKRCYDYLRMREIRLGLERGLDVSMYADPELDVSEMRIIRYRLEGMEINQGKKKIRTKMLGRGRL